jgi:hypothetical protein
VKGRHRAAAPDGRRLPAGAVGEHIGVAVGAARGDHDADLVGAEIVAPRRARRVDGDDDGGALSFRDVLRRAARRVDDLIGPERRIDLVDVEPFVEALALAFGKVAQARQKLGREIPRIVRRVEKGAGVVVRIVQRTPRDGIALLAEENIRPMRLATGFRSTKPRWGRPGTCWASRVKAISAEE